MLANHSFYKNLVIVALLAAGFTFANAVEGASLRLTWNDNSSNESGFKVERQASNGSFVQIASVGANITSYTDSGLASGQRYCYTVRAFNSAGTSDPSNLACGTTPTTIVGDDSGSSGGSSGTTGSSGATSGFNNVSLTSDGDSGSTRGSVQTGDQRMIGGFIIEGNDPAVVLIRGRGPSMGDKPFNVPGTLSNPQLHLFSDSSLIAQNDNWQDAPQCDSQLVCGGASHILTTGLDPCQPNPGQTSGPAGCARESAILAILPPGAYTAMLSGVSGKTGIGLVEVFEIDSATNASKLVNISTRAVVRSKDDIMIGGVIVGGSQSKTFLIRGRGPSMGSAPFDVRGVLSNPHLQLYSGTTMIAQNDNWQDGPQCDPLVSCGDPAQIQAVGEDPCQPNPGESTAPPGCSREAALLITLPPGAYTAALRGANGSTGVGLIEIFTLN